MTETTPEAATSSNRPADAFRQIIATLLAPLFLEASGDIEQAYVTALQALNASQASNPADLLAVAQVVACGLTALHSLSASIADDMPLPMRLRLRANAVALQRTAEQQRRALRKNDPDIQVPGTATAKLASPSPANHATMPETPPKTPAPQPAPAPVSAAQWQAMWGSAAASVAEEYAAALPRLPPAERKIATVRAAALSSAANDLLARLDPADLGHAQPAPS